MARQESDREDLLREATALIERVELKLPQLDESVVVGFRRDRSASIFWGTAFVAQLNRKGELRRAFADGKLLKAVDGHWASLSRERQDDCVILLRHDLSPEEERSLNNRITAMIIELRETLFASSPRYEIVGHVPADLDVLEIVRKWLAGLTLPLAVAAVPNVTG